MFDIEYVHWTQTEASVCRKDGAGVVHRVISELCSVPRPYAAF